MRISYLATLAFALVLGCEGSQSPAGDPTGDDGEPDPTTSGGKPGCSRDVLEKDAGGPPPMGSNVDPESGEMVDLPSEFVVSTTYLTLKEGKETWDEFYARMVPIQGALSSHDGLLAVYLTTSESCGSARTLAVWRDEGAMYAFSTGKAHSAAAESIGELSRGESQVLHWKGAEAKDASWEVALAKLGAEDGPYY